jgi:hypothetical protein
MPPIGARAANLADDFQRRLDERTGENYKASAA